MKFRLLEAVFLLLFPRCFRFCKEGAPGFAPGIRTPEGLGVARFEEVKQTAAVANVNAANVNAANNAVTNIATSTSLAFMSVALIQIGRQLNEIEKTQSKIINILLDDKKSQQRGDLNYLGELLHNFKYNYNDISYRNNTYSKVEDIKRLAMQNIPFYKTRIADLLADTNFVKTHATFNDKMTQLNQMFEEYRIASYLYAYASFVGAVILGNYEPEYINNVRTKITDASQKYRELYTEAYNLLEDELDSTIGNFVLKGVSDITKVTGIGLSKVPLLNKSQLDENIIDAGNSIRSFSDNKSKKAMQRFVDNKSDNTRLFTNGLEMLDRLHNDETEIYCDREYIYLVS